jgi:hypothetical protein
VNDVKRGLRFIRRALRRPPARAAKNVMTLAISEQAARKYSPTWKLFVESLIQPTMNGPT